VEGSTEESVGRAYESSRKLTISASPRTLRMFFDLIAIGQRLMRSHVTV